MVVRAVTHHVGLLVQQPLLSALRPLLQNFPQLLLQAAHSCSAETAAGLFGQLQYQVKQVGTPPDPPPLPPPPQPSVEDHLCAFFQAIMLLTVIVFLDQTNSVMPLLECFVVGCKCLGETIQEVLL